MSDNVLIGIIESQQQIEDELSDYTLFRTNKIGGYPVLSPELDSRIVSQFNSLVCHLCAKQLTFVLQIYCPIDDTLTDRVLYLFVCINSECNQNKWYAYRCVTPFIQTSGQTPQKYDDMWIDGQSDWGDTDAVDTEQMDSASVCANLMSKLEVQSTQTKSSLTKPIIANKSVQYFRPLYVTVIDEPIGSQSNDKHVNQLIETYEKSDGNTTSSDSSSNACNNSKEMFEQNFLETIYRNDRQNYQFFKRLSNCPKQVIRYEWMGNALLNSDNHKLVVPKCESCGADRCFEMQLMPALITYLKPLSDVKSAVDLDFASIVIYSCGHNCLKNDSFCTEFCITLTDPDNAFIDKIHDKLKVIK